MSTIAPTLEPRSFPRPGLGLLTRVELRKTFDTRAGAWTLGVTAVVTILIAVLRASLGADADRGLDDVLALALLPGGVALGVLGILLVTSEWSQRTALSTFALVPDRTRVVRAKVLAALTLGVGALVTGLVVSLLATLVGGAAEPWSLSAGDLGQAAAGLLLTVVWGLAFGLVLGAPAPAIVAYFVLPTVFSVLGAVVPSLDGTWEWLDANIPITNLQNLEADAGDWTRLTVSGTVWILLPFVLGVFRLLRREVK